MWPAETALWAFLNKFDTAVNVYLCEIWANLSSDEKLNSSNSSGEIEFKRFEWWNWVKKRESGNTKKKPVPSTQQTKIP